MSESRTFSVGDILVSKVQHAGCSYRWQFGKVVRITGGGRLRIRLLESNYDEEIRNGAGMGSSKIKVTPDDHQYGEPLLCNKWGNYYRRTTATSFHFEPYDSERVYIDFINDGD